MSPDDIAKLGPLAVLAGIWEGAKGSDMAPSVPHRHPAHSPYRERMVFEPIGRVDNHEQVLYGLRYSTRAWRIGAEDSFHEEVGYWLWDAARSHVMRCFLVPRGVSVIAGGTVAPDARRFTLHAELGSPTHGICSNPFLDEEFRTESYRLTVTIHDTQSLSYEEETVLHMPGRLEPFHHTDANTLRKVAEPDSGC